jgi:hypothetical protein
VRHFLSAPFVRRADVCPLTLSQFGPLSLTQICTSTSTLVSPIPVMSLSTTPSTQGTGNSWTKRFHKGREAHSCFPSVVEANQRHSIWSQPYQLQVKAMYFMPSCLKKPSTRTDSASSTRWSYVHKIDFSNSNGSKSSTGSRNMLQEVLVGACFEMMRE